jgi:hypothetical protein
VHKTLEYFINISRYVDGDMTLLIVPLTGHLTEFGGRHVHRNQIMLAQGGLEMSLVLSA